MVTVEKNIFVVGAKATGESFFGRKEEIQELSSIFSGVRAVHLIAPTKAGKSSLAKTVFDKNGDTPNQLCVELCMAAHQDAAHFWTALYKKLRRAIIEADLRDPRFDTYFEEIDHIDQGNSMWFGAFTEPFQSILTHIGRRGYRLVLSIDEFDDVVRIFEQKSYYFQMLREIFYDPGFHTSGVIISRRPLKTLETRCPDISTFHGVFDKMPLRAFNQEDMQEYYTALEHYGIILTDNAKDRLIYYTGRMPYLCCMLARRMVAQRSSFEIFDAKTVDSVFQMCLPQIDEYYDDLIRYVETDGHLELLYYLSIDSVLPKEAVERDRKNMEIMGVLSHEEFEGKKVYYAFSRDFMTYFRLKPLDLPEWKMMTACEKKIKKIFSEVYPELVTTTYQDLLDEGVEALKARIHGKYPGIDLKWNQIRVYCENLSAHKKNPSVLDVLTLAQVIDRILKKWDEKFCHYFNGDPSWKTKLELIKEIRNPMAHAQMEYISKEKLAPCMKYCEEIIRLSNQQSD